MFNSRYMKKIIILIVSLFTFLFTNAQEIKSEYLFLEVFTAVGNEEAGSFCLAKDTNSKLFWIFNIGFSTEKTREIYYDGKNISGSYVFVGTIALDDIKTIPAYMPKDNFYKFYNNVSFIREDFIKIVKDQLTYCVIK